MSYCRKEGKDVIIFATPEDHKVPSKVELPNPEPQPGLILPNGDINWGCPCLGGMATGPCGVQFREAFSCFHYSEAEPKGSDCYDVFKTMQECMSKYPTLYNKDDDDSDLPSEIKDGDSSMREAVSSEEKSSLPTPGKSEETDLKPV